MVEISEKLMYNVFIQEGREDYAAALRTEPAEEPEIKIAQGQASPAAGAEKVPPAELLADFACGSGAGGTDSVHLRHYRRPGRAAAGARADEEKTSRYEKAYLCADSPSVSYLNDDLEPAGTAVRGSAVTVSSEHTRKKDGVTYYLTYLDSLKYGYVSEDNLTDNPNDVMRETSVFVRTPQNLRLDPETVELGGLLEKGTELKIVGYDYMTDGVVHLYEVTNGEETGYISGEYTASTQESAMEVYDRFGTYIDSRGTARTAMAAATARASTITPARRRASTDNVMPEHVLRALSHLRPGRAGEYRRVHRIREDHEDQCLRCQHHGRHVHRLSTPRSIREYSPTADSYANNTIRRNTRPASRRSRTRAST